MVNQKNPSVENSEHSSADHSENPSLSNSGDPFVTIKIRSLIRSGLIGLIISGFLGTILAIPWALLVLFGNPDSETYFFANLDSRIILLILNLWIYGVIAFWCFAQIRQSNLNFQHLVGQFPRSKHWLRLLLLVVPVLMLSLGSGQLFLATIAGFLPEFAKSLVKENILSTAIDSSVPVAYNAFVILLAVFVAPVLEELFFRGLILQRLTTKWGITAGIIVSSLMFGILHVNVVGLSVFGIVLSVIYLQTRTLWIPLLIHVLNNSIIIFASLLSEISSPSVPTQNLEQFFSSWRVGILYVAFSAPWLILYLYQNWPKGNSRIPYWDNAERSE